MNIIAEYLDLEPESLLQRISLRSDQTRSTMVRIYSWPTVDSYVYVCVCVFQAEFSWSWYMEDFA